MIVHVEAPVFKIARKQEIVQPVPRAADACVLPKILQGLFFHLRSLQRAQDEVDGLLVLVIISMVQGKVADGPRVIVSSTVVFSELGCVSVFYATISIL